MGSPAPPSRTPGLPGSQRQPSLGLGNSSEAERTGRRHLVAMGAAIFVAEKEQHSQFGCQGVTYVTTVDPEKLLVPSFKKLRVALMTAKWKRKMTKATQETEVPTWGQLKKLTTEAWQMAEKQEVEATPSTMFRAMLALVSCQSSAKSCAAKSKDSE
ncbi:hypothetical protein QTO34_013060 [Cnephaeus nilssonii]|uniref:Rec21/ENK19 domain-containing protein n=1 Tax=Cnephaeus nilssonii TaxID=3371016 RepID=A0AA40HAI1_CNENI|nr:hypothetical protein QTO34_013060 [Eptesicus nilssonii]